MLVIASMPRLKILDVGHCGGVTYKGFHAVTRECRQLQHVTVSGTQVTKAAVAGVEAANKTLSIVLSASIVY